MADSFLHPSFLVLKVVETGIIVSSCDYEKHVYLFWKKVPRARTLLMLFCKKVYTIWLSLLTLNCYIRSLTCVISIHSNLTFLFQWQRQPLFSSSGYLRPLLRLLALSLQTISPLNLLVAGVLEESVLKFSDFFCFYDLLKSWFDTS